MNAFFCCLPYALLLVCSAVEAAERTNIVIEGKKVFPESLTSTADGQVFIGSMGDGTIYRRAPGGTSAAPWIDPRRNGMNEVLGVLADEPRHTLWVCAAVGDHTHAAPEGEPVLKAFDLKSGTLRASYVFPGGQGLCNDIAVTENGTAYVTDTVGGRILRLKPGATALDVWAADKDLSGADGIAMLGGRSVCVNTYLTGMLLRIEVRPEGTSGRIERLETSRLLVRPDGMRPIDSNRLLLVEGAGRLDEITLAGKRADIRVLKADFSGPTAVARVGDDVYVLEGKLAYRTDPLLQGLDPGPFRAIAIRYRGN